MTSTIIVENFMLFHFDKKYFHIKINICGDMAKIQFFRIFSSTLVPCFNSAAIFSLLLSNSPELYLQNS